MRIMGICDKLWWVNLHWKFRVPTFHPWHGWGETSSLTTQLTLVHPLCHAMPQLYASRSVHSFAIGDKCRGMYSVISNICIVRFGKDWLVDWLLNGSHSKLRLSRWDWNGISRYVVCPDSFQHFCHYCLMPSSCLLIIPFQQFIVPYS
jgi:hypothetical protein